MQLLKHIGVLFALMSTLVLTNTVCAQTDGVAAAPFPSANAVYLYETAHSSIHLPKNVPNMFLIDSFYVDKPAGSPRLQVVFEPVLVVVDYASLPKGAISWTYSMIKLDDVQSIRGPAGVADRKFTITLRNGETRQIDRDYAKGVPSICPASTVSNLVRDCLSKRHMLYMKGWRIRDRSGMMRDQSVIDVDQMLVRFDRLSAAEADTALAQMRERGEQVKAESLANEKAHTEKTERARDALRSASIGTQIFCSSYNLLLLGAPLSGDLYLECGGNNDYFLRDLMAYGYAVAGEIRTVVNGVRGPGHAINLTLEKRR